jgi:hypothetical protein
LVVEVDNAMLVMAGGEDDEGDEKAIMAVITQQDLRSHLSK